MMEVNRFDTKSRVLDYLAEHPELDWRRGYADQQYMANIDETTRVVLSALDREADEPRYLEVSIRHVQDRVMVGDPSMRFNTRHLVHSDQERLRALWTKVRQKAREPTLEEVPKFLAGEAHVFGGH